eukprot:TRINITY_DN4132_c0_g1_i1.p1 TRINITY_DN4132_c0_g1~~TRINITY_DN4132_c0_g1_i1.p1  ORF type:complete len:1051 (+),score=283.91 TRINITY_DN4132_c0_g1_i1:1466-4618(+)
MPGVKATWGKPHVAGVVRKNFKPPAKVSKEEAEGKATKLAEKQKKPFYPPSRGRTAEEVLEAQLKEKMGDKYEPPAKRKKVMTEGEEQEEPEVQREVHDSELPPAMLKLRKEVHKKQKDWAKQEILRKLEKECTEKGVKMTKAMIAEATGEEMSGDESDSSSSSSSASSSSSEESVDEQGNPREKVARLAVSEFGCLYFEGKVLNHQGSRHMKKGILVVSVDAKCVQMFDRTGKQFGNRPNPGYPVHDTGKLKMNEETKIAGKTVKLGPAVTEEEYLNGAFFLRKNQRRRMMEKQRRKAEERQIRIAALGEVNHLSHTGSSITYGTSMVSRSAAISSAFRPMKFRMYKSKGGFTMPKKAEAAKSTMPTFDPEAEKAVVLYRAEYKFDSLRRPLTSVVVDPIIGDMLRPHQIIGVKFLWDCITGERVSGHFGCILADEMGLGKSIQAIALLWTALNQGRHGERLARKAVVVAPSSLVQNWCNELVKWLGEGTVNPCAIAQSTVRGERIINSFQHDSDRNVLVISYDQLRKYEQRFKSMTQIGLVICDEGHRLKNAEIKTTKAVDMIPTRRRVILSGTPLQNDLGEFHAMVNFCNPGIVGNLNTFKTVFEVPIMAGREPMCPENEKILGGARAHYLATLTNKFILQRKQTINEKYLPSKLEQTVFVRPSDFQVKLYNAIVQNKEELIDNEDGKRTSPALVMITSLKKLCNHPDLIYEIIENSGGMKSVKAVFPKGYKMHSSMPDVSGKMDFVAGLCKELKAMPQRNRDKVVIVSNYTQTLHVIAALCKKMEVGYFQLDGNTPIKKRQQLVDQFNVAGSPEVVFLLSSKAGGVGLNLIGANRLILYDPDWNPANDAQAMGRVWRDGQKKKVFIYRLLTTGTIEEKVYQRQVSKQGLSANVMDATDKSKQHFTNNDLRALFLLKTDTLCETHDLLGCKCKEPKTEKGNGLFRAFKTHARSGPRMDELKGWQHLTCPGEGNDTMLKVFGKKMVTFLFCNERESEKMKAGVETSKGFEGDTAKITCDNASESSSEISVESDDEGADSGSSSDSSSE